MDKRQFFEAAMKAVDSETLRYASKAEQNFQRVGMPRRERRKLARAYAAQQWRDRHAASA